MSEHKITVESGSTVRLTTAGKYCDRDILVTAEAAAVPVVRAIDYSGWDSGSFTETLDMGATLEYAVAFKDGDILEVTTPNGEVVIVEGIAKGSVSTELIRFSIAIDYVSGVGDVYAEFTAEKGMTWGEWVGSKYNNYSDVKSGMRVLINPNGEVQRYYDDKNTWDLWIFSSSYRTQYGDTVIVENEQYVASV